MMPSYTKTVKTVIDELPFIFALTYNNQMILLAF